MAKAQNVHVTHRGNGDWAVVGAGNTRASSLHNTQEAAIAAARPMAQSNHSELVIHGRDNLIREKDSYGHDSFPPRG